MSLLLSAAISGKDQIDTTLIPYIKTSPSEIELWTALENIILPLFIILIIIAFFTLIIRAIVLWYWKINKILEILEDIEYNTRKEIDEPLEEIDPKQKIQEDKVLKKFRNYTR